MVYFKKIYIITVVLFLVWGGFSVMTEEARASAKQSICLPVVMYHQISRKTHNVGPYIIYYKELERDLDYIAASGYTTVTVKDLIDYVNGRSSLPEKPIMLTFDDGHETVSTILLPMLKERDMCAVVSVIGSLADLYTETDDHNDSYSYLTWEEIARLSETDEIEIQNHSYDMHSVEKGGRRGIAALTGESDDKYFAALSDDVGKMQLTLMKKCKTIATAMVYPYGSYTDYTVQACKRLGFVCTMTCEERLNTVTRHRTESLFNLGRYNRSGEISTEDFFSHLETERCGF